MKKLLFVLCLATLTGCSYNPYVQIGSVNMISNRNISTLQEYNLLNRFSSASPKQISDSRALTVNDAVDNVVKTVPGGEYLMNVKLYRNKYGYFAAEGDVWGLSGTDDINGLKVSSYVIWNHNHRPEKVKILEFKSNQKVSILTDNDKIREVDLAELIPDKQSVKNVAIRSNTERVEQSSKKEYEDKPTIKITTKKGEILNGYLLKENDNNFLIYDLGKSRKSIVYKNRIDKSELM